VTEGTYISAGLVDLLYALSHIANVLYKVLCTLWVDPHFFSHGGVLGAGKFVTSTSANDVACKVEWSAKKDFHNTNH